LPDPWITLTESSHYTTVATALSPRRILTSWECEMGTESGSRRILIVDDDRGLRHALSALLAGAGHGVESAADGPEALTLLQTRPFDIVLLDIGLPSMSGLDVLARACELATPPLVIMMTADDTPQSLLQAVKRRAYRYIRKPFPPNTIVDVVNDAVAPSAALAIDVISARPEWLELVAPCTLQTAERIQSFVMHLEATLPEDVREAVAQAFRELLMNAVEWGGKLDPNRKVRISCVRAKKMLFYRIADPGEGFDIDGLRHAAISNPEEDPIRHLIVREEKGLRPGGFGLALTQSLVDELIYNEARNEVIFVKYLE
jgi:CheY-like chemotaxis protein